MNDLAIQVAGLSKRYQLGRRESYKSLRDSLASIVSSPFRGLVSAIQGRHSGNGQLVVSDEFIWALRDVSFEIKRGEVVGIIGNNGAGKSTLLKILSRITEPTEGEVMLSGRVGSLLEVGTGFHPELTGRENIYLNSAILGMRRSEIEYKFDEIVSFAEIEKFIDTPVKHFSSGMYVRLAFAVAAHLEPEILLVDEVLAVGDASFQKKCLGKVGEIAGGGRTVLLVSHNMGAIKSLSSAAIWIDGGRVKEIGLPSVVVNNYLAAGGAAIGDGLYDAAYLELRRVRHQKYAHQLKLKSVCVKDVGGRVSSVHLEGADIFLELEFVSAATNIEVIESLIRVRTMEGHLIFTCLPGKQFVKILPGLHKAIVSFNLSPLLPGIYQGDIVLLSHIPQDNVSPAFQFEVIPDSIQTDDYRTVLFPSTSAAPESAHSALGLIRVRAYWNDLQAVEG